MRCASLPVVPVLRAGLLRGHANQFFRLWRDVANFNCFKYYVKILEAQNNARNSVPGRPPWIFFRVLYHPAFASA